MDVFSYDALIVGAGPAGASTALMLAQAGWRVCLLHRSPRASTFASAQPRRLQACDTVVRTGETLPAASRATLRTLGVWPTFLQDDHLPSPGSVSWWDGDRPIEQDSVFDPSGPGWHVDRPRFDRRLREAARAAGAEVLDDARLVDAQFLEAPTHAGAGAGTGAGAGAHWIAALTRDDHACTCVARTLILATGRAKPSLPRGIVRDRLDRLVGLAALVSAPARFDCVDQRIWIEATPWGWWYSAPTPSGAWTVTFFTDLDDVPTRDGREALSVYWLRQLAHAPHTAGRMSDLGLSVASLARATGPGALRMIAADSYRQVPCGGPGWLAAGDAAAAWDPLSGQGIEKALRSGIRAARTVDALLRGGDRAAVLADYARQEDALDRHYRQARRAYYAQVRRWPDAIFWQRRAGHSLVPGDGVDAADTSTLTLSV